jgi:hypothetical protein
MQLRTTPMIARSSDNRSKSAIEQGRLKFEIHTKAEKPMKIDQHPFPTNKVEVSSKGTHKLSC